MGSISDGGDPPTPDAETLRRRLEEYEAVFDAMPVMIWHKDTNNRTLRVNKGAAEFDGVKPSDVAGRSAWDMYPKERADQYYQDDLEVIRTGRPKLGIIERHVGPGTGVESWVETGKVPVRDRHGDVIGVIAFAIDITERKRAEERLQHAQKMESIGRLAGGIAHDFNNLLVGIRGFAEFLARKVVDPKLVGYAGQIVDAANRAAELTRRLLAFSRKGRTVVAPVDVHASIRAVMAIAERTFDRRIALESRLDAPAHIVLGDAHHLESVLMNLAVNARDAMPEGGRLSFESRLTDVDDRTALSHVRPPEPGRYLEVAVRDTGSGMTRETQARICEPFFTTKPPGEGTGLGLAAVYGILREHKGGLHVESESGRGTTMRFLLPLAPAGTAIAVAPKAPSALHVPTPAAVAAAPPAPRILVVDDEPAVRALAREALREAGYDVVLAVDGVEGVETFRRAGGRFDLVLLDVVMPRMGGGDAFRALQAIDPCVCVLMTSGYAFEAIERGLLEAGAKGFLPKPYTTADLVRRVGDAIAARAALRV